MESIKDVIKVSGTPPLYMKMRPKLLPFLTGRKDKYEMILVSDFDSVITGEFVRQLPAIANCFNNRILSSEDYRRRMDIIEEVPEEVRDRALYMSFQKECHRDVPWLPIPYYEYFFTSGPTINPAIAIFARKKNLRPELPDPDHHVQRAATYLTSIHKESFSPAGEFQPNKFSESVFKWGRTIKEYNKPKNNPPKKSVTVAKCERLTRSRLQEDNKMILLVDLDNTILHSCSDYLASRVDAEDVYAIPDGMHVRFRPGTHALFCHLEEKYEMIVVTKASGSYAADCVALIDEDGGFFKDRIFAFEDFDDQFSKVEVLNHFPTDVRDMIVIIDDKKEVWADTPMIKVPAYTYWHGDHCAFDIEESLQVLEKELETGGKMKVKEAREDLDIYLLDDLFYTLEELHRICDPGGECKTNVVQEFLGS